VSTTGKTVEGRVGEDGIGEEAHPPGNVAVAGDDETGATVAFDDERIEVFGLVLGEAMEAAIVHDEEVGREVTAEDRLEAMVGEALAELVQEQIAAPEEDRVAGPSSSGSKGLGQGSLADLDWSTEQDVLLALEQLEREELVQVAATQLDWGRRVEVVEADLLFKVGGEESAFEGELAAELHFIGPDQRQKATIVKLLNTHQGQLIGGVGRSLPNLRPRRSATRSGSGLIQSHLRRWRWR